MIVRANKGYETRNDILDRDWYNDGNFVVDENTPEGKALAEKIIQYYPLYDLVLDEAGKLIDIIGYERVQITCPQTAIADQQIDISASAEGGEGIEAILYIDGVEQARDPMPAAWQVIFDTAGTYLVEVDTGRHGKVSQEVVVS